MRLKSRIREGYKALNFRGGSLHLKSWAYLTYKRKLIECGKSPRGRLSHAKMAKQLSRLKCLGSGNRR
jgi:hypothetical protein